MGIINVFSYCYDKVLHWSRHRHAPYYLAGVSFAESSFFPVPPDVMLISMGLAVPSRAWRYACIATLFSVLGGILGYLIGFYAIELIEPYFNTSSTSAAGFHQVRDWFRAYGVWMVILAGFTPFPYKLFTITAGAMQMAFIPFVIGSLIGRSLRFFLVASLLYFTGETLQVRFRYYIDMIGWSTLLFFIVLFFFIK